MLLFRNMNLKISIALIALFCSGIIGGYLLRDITHPESAPYENTSKQIRQNGAYTFINPLLECEVADGSIDANKENFEDDLIDYSQGLKSEYGLTDIAIYFRDLNNGPSFGVNTQNGFFPASLLKVPIMMAYYHWFEQEPRLLNTEIRYTEKKEFGYLQTVMPREELIPGQVYRIDELIRRMIVYSDNQAAYLLTKNLPKAYMTDLFTLLGVKEDVLSDNFGQLTVKEYASFFRILYNSAYLSRENSEKALALLATTEYREALPAGVADGVAVAHKFGEAGTLGAERQLHDCGIVYFPGHPYLACIMTRGHEVGQLKDAITSVSRFIYAKIDEQY